MAQIVKRISAPYKIISANNSVPVSFTLGSGTNSANLIINGAVTTTDLSITGNIIISGNSSVGNVNSALGNFTSLTATQFSTGNAQITGGAIDNTAIGATTASTGRFTTLVATGNIVAANFSGNTSGTNTGDQTITLTGNVTGSGTGSFNTTIASTGVAAGTYILSSITVGADGRITSASNGSSSGGTITALNGDVFASGSGNVTATLVNTTVTAGSYSYANITVDSKGRVTSATAGTLPAGVAAITDLTGDASAHGPGNVALTLATVNSNTGSFGNATYIPTFTVNGKGLITAASQTAVSIPSGSISVTGTDITMSGSTGTAITNATLANTTVVAGFYTLANITIDSKGRITSAANGTGGGGGTITALNGDVYASGAGNVTATLSNTTVSAGSYTYANITVDSKGRLTSATSGSLPGSSYNAAAVAITGGNIDGTWIGNTTPVGGKFTTLQATSYSGNIAVTSVTGISGQVVYGDPTAYLGQDSAFTFNDVTKALSVTGNITGGNIISNGTVTSTSGTFTGNVTAANFSGNVVQTLMPSNNQTGTTYTLVLGDAGKFLTFGNASPTTVTIPSNANVAFYTDTTLSICQTGAGKVTVAGQSGVTINSQAGNKSLAAQYAGAVLQKTGTDTWLLIGNLIA